MSKSLTPFLPVFNFTYSVETSSSNSNCVWALIKTSSSFINLEILLLGKSAFRSAVFLWYIFLNCENNSEEIFCSNLSKYLKLFSSAWLIATSSGAWFTNQSIIASLILFHLCKLEFGVYVVLNFLYSDPGHCAILLTFVVEKLNGF